MPTTGKGFAFFLIYYLHRHYILCKSMGYEYEHAMQYAPNTCTRLTKYLQYFSSLLFKSLLTYTSLIGGRVGLLIMHSIELPSGGSQGIFSIQLSKKQLNKHIGSPVDFKKSVSVSASDLDSWVCAGPTIWGSLQCVRKNSQSESGVQVYTNLRCKIKGFFTDVGRQQKKLSLSYLGTYSNPMLPNYWLYVYILPIQILKDSGSYFLTQQDFSTFS